MRKSVFRIILCVVLLSCVVSFSGCMVMALPWLILDSPGQCADCNADGSNCEVLPDSGNQSDQEKQNL
ncbi:MAG TPA: hypothetical protein PKM84_01125, partial [Candidatus Pacearchaeota archaeon]|nr:hypothetical protein [Candidatus Pacearchaeota archaeon]